MTKELTNPNPPAVVAVSEATKLKNRLRDLANKAGETAYLRLGLAQQLLLDREWIASEHAGDSHVALETIEAEFFGDLCGSMPLARLLKMREVVPEVDWKTHRYNLQRVAAAYQEKLAGDKEPREPVVRITKEQHEKALADVEHFRAATKHQEKLVKDHEATIRQTRSEVQQLRQELNEKNALIARLEGRIEELEKVNRRVGTLQPA